jgi:hypothetical protein
MPGSYAHITLVNLASEKRRLKQIPGFPTEAIDAANLHSNFLELGSISPDYPYLHLASGDSKEWADAMHYTHTCQTISVGADLVRNLPQGISKEKCLSWLMGYSAHVVTDMCIHPVVELKVGPYKGNETPHRRCEMHQDVFIFPRIGTGIPQTAQHLKATILNCGSSADPTKLDGDVKALWTDLLGKVYSDICAVNPPDLDEWHQKCDAILEKLLPTTSQFVGFARHVCDGLGFAYPAPGKVDMASYIEDLRLPTPEGRERHMHYDEIFDLAIKQVQQVWLQLTRYALGFENSLAFRDEEWNLDTGRNQLAADNRLVFWEVA